jgi:hypothetical protein
MPAAGETEARAKLAKTPTANLVDMLRVVADPKLPEERMVRAWIIDALENRYPNASAAVELAFDSAQLALMETGVEPEVDYVAVLLGAIPEVAA